MAEVLYAAFGSCCRESYEPNIVCATAQAHWHYKYCAERRLPQSLTFLVEVEGMRGARGYMGIRVHHWLMNST